MKCKLGFYLDEESEECEALKIYFGKIADRITIEVEPSVSKNQETGASDVSHTFSIVAVNRDYMQI